MLALKDVAKVDPSAPTSVAVAASTAVVQSAASVAIMVVISLVQVATGLMVAS